MILEIKRKAQAAPDQPPATGGSRDINAIYKAVQAYHARHTNQASPDYWEQAIADLVEVSRQHDNRPLIVDLLAAVLKDLERDYKGVSDTCRSAAADRTPAAHERPTN